MLMKVWLAVDCLCVNHSTVVCHMCGHSANVCALVIFAYAQVVIQCYDQLCTPPRTLPTVPGLACRCLIVGSLAASSTGRQGTSGCAHRPRCSPRPTMFRLAQQELVCLLQQC